jgi:hypothetical protein
MDDLQSQPNVQQRNSNQTQDGEDDQHNMPRTLRPTAALQPLLFLRSQDFDALSCRACHCVIPLDPFHCAQLGRASARIGFNLAG